MFGLVRLHDIRGIHQIAKPPGEKVQRFRYEDRL